MANYNLDKTLDIAIARFAKNDPDVMAQNAAVDYDSATQAFNVPYFGTKYRVHFPDGQVEYDAREDEVSINTKIILLHYLTYATGVPITGTKVAFKELPDGAIYNGPFYRRTIQPMLSIFGKDAARLEELGQKLGGQKAGLGDFSITVSLFPRIAITYVIWEGDEEFEASGTILFDESVKDYLPTEDCVILASSVIWALKGMSNKK